MVAAKKPKPPKITETQEQIAIVEYLDWALPEDVVWTHVRGERAGAYQRILAKKMGVKPKFPDFLFIYKTIHLWIEMKERGFSRKKKFNEHELAQMTMHNRLRLAGDFVEICETREDVAKYLRYYGLPVRSESLTSERIRRGFLAAMNEGAE
jgi:hypothetical protein